MVIEILVKVLIGVIFVTDFALNIWANKENNTLLKCITKPLLVPLIILFYTLNASSINWLIVAGLLFGFLGDVFLMWEEKEDVFFKIGLASFLIGHILYATAFIQSTSCLKIVPSWFYIFCIPYAVFMFLAIKILWSNLNSVMKVGVGVYLFAILTMSFTSLCRVWIGAGISFWLPFIGSLLFVASDSALAYETFKTKGDKLGVFIMVTYVLAQAFIACGFLF